MALHRSSRPLALVVLVMTVLGGLLQAPATAAGSVPTTLTLSGPAGGVVDTSKAVTATLGRDDTATPVAGEPVRFERQVGGVWQLLATVATDAEGTAQAPFVVKPDPQANAFRAVFDGTDVLSASASEVVVVAPRRRVTAIVVDAPRTIVDETEVRLVFRWKAGNGAPVAGDAVVHRKVAGGTWRRFDDVSFGVRGGAKLVVGPRKDTRWRVVGSPGRWWEGATSAVHRLDNVPPGRPVAYPRSAPRPRIKLPQQPRATGAGANARIHRIPDAMWASMTGRSWHQGCPVGRAELRVVLVNYWGYDGYRRRGEIVVRDSIAAKTGRLFTDLHRARMPIRSMYRVDRFGWSGTLHGGDNYGSMSSGNTSGFNCRGVVGNPGVRSPHSYGRSIDINTWENPYHSRTGTVPNTWWVSRSHPRIAWRSGAHKMVRIMRANGFRWTYGTSDAHHFDG
jgi:hypothetical protein